MRGATLNSLNIDRLTALYRTLETLSAIPSEHATGIRGVGARLSLVEVKIISNFFISGGHAFENHP